MTEDAAALAIAVGQEGATGALDAPARGEDAGDAIAGRPGAICRRPNTLRLQIPDRRASLSLTNRRLQRILSPSFCQVNRFQNSKIVFRPLPWRLRPNIPHLRPELLSRHLRPELSRMRNYRRDCRVRYLPLRLLRFLKKTEPLWQT